MFADGLAEIVLVVRDVSAAARFYREVVGLVPETEPDAAWAWFWAGQPGVAQRIALHKGSLLFEERTPIDREGPERWGPIHYAFNVARARLDAALAHLRSHDVALHGPVRFDWMRATAWYFYDPDGNLLELWSPDPT